MIMYALQMQNNRKRHTHMWCENEPRKNIINANCGLSVNVSVGFVCLLIVMSSSRGEHNYLLLVAEVKVGVSFETFIGNWAKTNGGIL